MSADDERPSFHMCGPEGRPKGFGDLKDLPSIPDLVARIAELEARFEAHVHRYRAPGFMGLDVREDTGPPTPPQTDQPERASSLHEALVAFGEDLKKAGDK